jgi:hypothetical protein
MFSCLGYKPSTNTDFATSSMCSVGPLNNKASSPAIHAITISLSAVN